MSKPQRIAMEMLTTEREYVKKLHLIDQVFHTQIMMMNREEHLFPNEVVPMMFSNVKSIYQFHHDFLLPQLEKRMTIWDEEPRIGDVMRKFAPFLKLYTDYVKNFDRSMTTISAWLEKSPKLASFVEEKQRLPECGNLSLQNHMLGPIQRVPRYEMLLKDYLKRLDSDSPDQDDTIKALELVKMAACHSNEAMKNIEKFRKLLEINESLGGFLDLVSPTRELIKEGKLMKISARSGLLMERYIFLFNDTLLVCQTMPTAMIGLKQQYRLKSRLEVDGMQVLEGDNLETPNTFYIKSKQKTIEFHTR
ncbi:hypothetical protein CAPTEDRAFT_122968 [Capitella teleta]|uniref:DH domain-containing protein n=1 Tax=Capitella teleta TaxID=283909 RepID=R7TWS2_CAPTE|nr:hypothetical protein CAPTEDRAFT_122968 [Capitella teleta]|eukprot:ELT98343.1 hypothetical protein CAPTEDRAFT_122968 [Capitella teleta]